MSRPFPYTFISCPCADTPVPDPARKRRSRESPQKQSPQKPAPPQPSTSEEKKETTEAEQQGEEEDEEQTFDPRSPRSNFSLYPPEQLLYCEECHQIKCPRCITEEIVSWYCPSCLFETPSTLARADGNRYVLPSKVDFICVPTNMHMSIVVVETVSIALFAQLHWL
jgi:dynactin-4